jgi:hypothetical protein
VRSDWGLHSRRPLRTREYGDAGPVRPPPDILAPQRRTPPSARRPPPPEPGGSFGMSGSFGINMFIINIFFS